MGYIGVKSPFFLVGNPYRPLFTTVTEWRVDPRTTQSCDWDGFEIESLESTCYAPLIPSASGFGVGFGYLNTEP